MPTSGNPILKSDFNNSQAILNDVLGVGENGYGRPVTWSDPVETTQIATAKQWNRFIQDLNLIHQHVANVSTNTAYFNTGTSIITASTVTNLISSVNYVSDAVRRYTCHPSQFVVYQSTSTFFYDSTSTRTLAWGVDPTLITHEVVVSFPTRLKARYYFNMGSYLTFVPYYQGNVIADIDGEWATFIDNLRLPAQEYRFDRQKYLAGSISTTWTSGTLTVGVLALVSADEKSIKFTTSYSNSESTTVYITPSGSTWTILI
jgi:hypothetical protein